MMKSKYIIDVDTGVDDAQALMLALSRPDVDVIAITCVAGNVPVDQVVLNTLKILTVWGRLDIPVFRGASSAMVVEGFTATHYHGKDGLGDADLDIAVSRDQAQKEHAVSAIIRLVNENPGEITLVALAPLTNIALALRQDPALGEKLKSITVMGGNTQGRGNVLPCAEFNFAVDPDAAFVVLSEMGRNLTVVPWEVNLTAATGQPWDFYDKWVETDTPKGRFMKAIVKLPAYRQRIERKMPIYRSCDLNAMLTVVDPSLVSSTSDVYATVELAGKYTRGMMVVDWDGLIGKKANITLVNAINTKLAQPLLEDMLL
ncbi:hypothetical protein DPMN_054594 [Dreissena polymorpha]|uniref:Inosine/uridine-preferring nucleoside hydrolase domain-containing protein n=2 Tax=Dreissena polymorpha TaxID=45954 RepID=A0A9D4HRS2_DREPO|nr:hypothetical protein DPMN_054594 [Dreissena polymorpha]